MSFINRYTKNKTFQFVYSEEFTERNTSVVFAIGSYNSLGLISKIDTNGNVIWEKTYQIKAEKEALQFKQIIKIGNENIEKENKYVVYASSKTNKYLLCFNSLDGSINWANLLLWEDVDVVFKMKKSESDSGFYISISDRNEIDTNKNPTLALFDSDGKFILGNKLYNPNEELIINNIDTDKGGVTAVGRYIEKDSVGVISRLNTDLKINYSIGIVEPYNTIHDIKTLEGNQFLISGYNNQEDGIYVSLINSQGENLLYNFPDSKNHRSELQIGNSGFYILISDSRNGYLYKLDWKFKIIWAKTIKLESENNNIRNFCFNSKTNKLTINTFENAENQIVINTDDNFKSCLTHEIDNPKLIISKCKVDGLKINFDNITIRLVNQDVIIQQIDSKKDNLCQDNSDFPCEKDETLCKLYRDINAVNLECLLKPDFLIERIQTSEYYDCIKKIYELIFVFDNEHSKFKLSKIYKSQLEIIKLFLDKPKNVSYSAVWNGIQLILESLLKQGNCNCGNDFHLEDNSSIQSGDIYLQSVGSLGTDSTKGILLRWALKGKLSTHLPKGNYAATEFNFNKPNDFVKIFRAKYEEYKVKLDFSSPPNNIYDNFWIYVIEGKIFHVKFVDLAKYNQIKSTINPLENPINFIKQYGASLIEIENRNELSFAVSPKFIDGINSDNIKIELLSVEENKIIAEKGASLRKTFTKIDLNSRKLISENIRTIRFASTKCVISTIEFEYYSDFITTTTKNKKWQNLGNFSLTTDTNVAYNRLEPKPNCLDTWLRYNDNAFVNSANYKNKWDSVNLNPESTILGTVKSYIDLSNAANNPQASEEVNTIDSSAVNLCNNPNYTPYFAPENSNKFDISNLGLLQIGSLDYHVARMLGLGTLDIESTVFNGKYIYMAEYITLGDLKDGFGRRRLQHLFCSLPTALADERTTLPIKISEIKKGIFYKNEDIAGSSEPITDADGRSQDGKTQYYSIFNEELPNEVLDANFFYKNDEFISSEMTFPVYAGLEYKKQSEVEWQKPELSYDINYFNIDVTTAPEKRNETKSIIIPKLGIPLFVKREKENGFHTYTSYGINWFSRSSRSTINKSIETILRPKNTLLPPTNINAVLIQKENPLLLTTSIEQSKYDVITQTDKTLVRLLFEYNHIQELINYHKSVNGIEIKEYKETPDNEEPFAEDIEIFFRNEIPFTVSGGISNVTDNGHLLRIETGVFTVASSGELNESYTPEIPNGKENNFNGSILLVNSVQYVINIVDNTQSFPIFEVFNRELSAAMLKIENLGTSFKIGDLFHAVENMQTVGNWGSLNPSTFKINLDKTTVYKEEIRIINTDCSSEAHVHKFRGIYENARIEKFLEKIDENNDGEFDKEDNGDFKQRHLGIYKITFEGYSLAQHSQFSVNNDNSVEWNNGIVRIHTIDILGPRKDFKVIKTENIGTTNDLILYIHDAEFSDSDDYKGKIMPIDVSFINQIINYYPGYRVYLYADSNLGLTKENVLPEGNQDVRYTIFGLKSHDFPNEYIYDNTVEYFSKLSAPTLMFGKSIVEPLQPEKPLGAMFATRPDFFGKSTYTFKTVFNHKPYSVQYNRASDIQFLSAIYDNSIVYDENNLLIPSTLSNVINNIFQNGKEAYFSNRWDNLLSFDYNSGDPNEDGQFKNYEGRRLPLPDSKKLIVSINAFINSHNEYYGNQPSEVPQITLITNLNQTVILAEGERNGELKIKDFVKDILLNCFVPLTEIPVIFDHVKDGGYVPINKKQVIRDRNGDLLKSSDAEFDMAPMMKIANIDLTDGANPKYETQFTDFGIDGASTAKYFYAVREINNQLKTGEYSEIIGPVNLVNTAPPTSPEINKVIPVLENRTLGINPSVEFHVNSYSDSHEIEMVNIYRALNPNDALTIRTMTLVKTVKKLDFVMSENNQLVINDDFSDLPEIPFGDPIFYKLSVSRKIKYEDMEGNSIINYVPSEASKLYITNIVENYSPESPILQYIAEPPLTDEITYITLFWNKTTYKGKYRIYKMNEKGNWTKIYELISNENINYVRLENTEINTHSLPIKSPEGKDIFHHFKVIAENTAGMLSSKENLLTIYNPNSWKDNGGIGDMVIERSFIVR